MAGPPSPQLHFFLPPNLTSAWDRDAVPLRLEIPPAARPAEAPLADLPEKQRAAAFVLQQWCGGKLAPFLQLNREQLETLQGLLAAEPCFFILPDRSTPALWAGDRLALLPSASSDAPPETPPPSQLPPAPNGNSRPAPRECPGPEVEGSEHYLAIRLPSREHPAYREIADLLRSEGFKLEPSNRRWWLRDRHKTLGFLGRFWRKLEQQWTAVFTPNFRRRTAHLSFAAPGCQVRSSDLDTKGGWEVDITLSAPGLDPRALQESLVQGRHWVQSGEGVILIDPADLARVEAGRRALDGNPEAGPALRSRHLVNRERLHDIEDILEEVSPGFRPPTEWAEQTRALRELSSLPAPTLPADLTAALRPYQHLGAAWLRHLHREGLGGILADEMGLGKTVQALALLASLQCDPPPGPPRPSLVVCPASLVENWRREAARFAPSLRVFIHRGNRRLEATADASAYDLVITSYGTLVRDREFFARLRFACLFADEAQHAKNRRTLNARSLRSLAADGRFLLTGTPVENSLEDLRSLIDIILPGAWSGPAAAAPGEDTSWRDERLRRLAAPYLLRRTKAAVAAELPPRIEQVLYCEMEDSQRAARH
ncbi:MAG: hypothetical protein EA425_16370 [Puniceicoccaceae bacterium]|nr:MAG: hypothetical protein EA425_16370 [Puniceicoccaceae bacterium]